VPRTPKFTERHITTAAPGRTHVFDTPGLYLYVSPKGLRRWIFRYSRPNNAGVTEISLGKLPYTSLTRAREIVSHFRRFLNDGIDPQEMKQRAHAEGMTFGQLAEQWIAANTAHARALPPSKRLQEARNLLLVHGKPLAPLVLKDITPEKIHSALAQLWEAHPNQAQRARLMIERVLDYAKVKRLRAGDNPARWRGNLKILFAKRQHVAGLHHASMPYQQVPAFLQELRTHRGSVASALEFTVLTACRSSEVLQAKWSEFDLVNTCHGTLLTSSEFDLPNCARGHNLTPTWIIPAARMKARNPHRVPLSDRAVELLKRQQERSGKNRHMAAFDNSKSGHVAAFDNSKLCPRAQFDSGFVFTGNRRDQPLSERAMYFLLRTMVPNVTVHGFRSSFRNWCAHTRQDRDLAELCLAHKIAGTEGAYWTDDMLEQRREIMDAWASYCG
jgi:integrase